ncbi:muconolactone Delta-isomerase [Variovorax sp. UC122_21]|jgi:muconolactone D-isomerase|uniref:muconolactone Delta-isomerase n=1 Tax=Variovorax TaxID=34072 RepID=UPI0019317327|nr:muconolactone Delta-isomerase family protein [Variovorax paradoxus]
MLFMLKVKYVPAPGLGDAQAAELRRRHDEEVGRLAARGTLLGIWRIAGTRSNLSLWQFENAQALHDAVGRLPLFAHLEIEATPLARHHLGGLCRVDAQPVPGLS